MNLNEIRELAEMNVRETASDGYDIMFEGFENLPPEHARKCIQDTLMPMIQRHKDMAIELLDIRDGIDKILKKVDDAVDLINPKQLPL